ncbi:MULTISPECIES: HPr(Ser) kinase/phosphatase [Bacillales]|uniref:HPr kinase/phosphorylase n=1 Tax=Brevibacillus brevis (strain 47 / JCM 6285 / NBRC 100599) TaxID=358681 RepID=HPRK_BREBN|nr:MULTISPECIES: HPr(Ser) kinase/phosphatase [Bacillales]C0Z6Q2.1 RecName: Full=HPr kinase/phosphorylase; Short=HPrK/P; AltName: Full=HPr(Ser) kinase/phosphorylase [Brevibacillus brevis NBRC 100599]KMZ44063.1 serine kinase [Bacillus sp. FJAT-27238]NRR03410.1 HPr kinase/phosphorylase [Brevibacillus sp. RS1.1]NRS49339.1 HPr kinase/phosphorylase [Brevibacillus sp. HB2.2]TQR32512.1 HPr kinase/phosphorylase [Lysinibacillus sp. SDF0063]UIO42044.1 HPr(Ser) kinase/phosphatase [Brevibacillus brevis]
MRKTNVSHLVDHFNMTILSGEEGLGREITVTDLSRPGLQLAGYYSYFAEERIQLFGLTEINFFQTLTPEERLERMNFLMQSQVPCFCVTRNQMVPEEMIDVSNRLGVPVLQSPLATTTLVGKVTNFLENRLAPTTTIHGVLTDIYGVGVLIMGSSGIGKSEAALELVKRGHRLVADDAVEIKQTQGGQLSGSAPELIQHLLEIRGVGIINIMTMFGAGAVRNVKNIEMVVQLELWEPHKMYERLGLDEETLKIMDTEIPIITVPVRPGRNLAVIIEVAAMNFRLKRMGYNAAMHFTRKQSNAILEDADSDL